MTDQDKAIDSQHKVKVAVFGSCVSRDVFNRKFNADYKKYFEVVYLQNQTSILSLMASPIAYDKDNLSPLKGYDKDTTEDELNKVFLHKLIELQPDILIVDFFADARFKTIKCAQSYLTVNEWKITKTPFYNELLKHNVPFVPSSKELSDNIHKFNTFMSKNLPNTKIILNQARGVYSYTDREGKVKFFNVKQINRINRKWSLLDRLFKEIVDPYVICAMSPKLKSYFEHPWGLGYVHYNKKYYQDVLNQLIDIEFNMSKKKKSSISLFKKLSYFIFLKNHHLT